VIKEIPYRAATEGDRRRSLDLYVGIITTGSVEGFYLRPNRIAEKNRASPNPGGGTEPSRVL
jgi:hypothetical protein